MPNADMINLLSKVSLAVVLMVIIITGSQGLWVFGRTYDAAIADRDEWKKLALTGLNDVQNAKHVRLSNDLPSFSNVTPNQVREKLDALKNVEP